MDSRRDSDELANNVLSDIKDNEGKHKQDIFGSGLLFPDPAVSPAGSIYSLTLDTDNPKSTSTALDGGWGWVIVATSFIGQIPLGMAFMTFGIIYVDFVEEFGGRSGPVGWIGSVFVFVGHLACVPVSILIDMYSCRVVGFVGGLILSLAFLLSSFATNAVMMLITYGVLGGVGFGASFLPCIVIVQQYFDRYRSATAGAASAGLSVGTLVTGPLLQLLIDTFNWRGALMVFSGIYLHVSLMTAFFRPISQYCKPQISPDTLMNETSAIVVFFKELKSKVSDIAIMKDIRFLLICTSGFLVPMSIAAFAMHTPSRAIFYGMERRLASFLPTFIGSATITARITFGCIGNLNCSNRLLLYGLGGVSLGVLILVHTVATTLPWIALSCVGFGLTSGCFTSLQPTALVDLVGISTFPRAQALYMIFFGAASLVSVPLVGYILDVTQDYSKGFHLVGSCALFGAFLALIVPLKEIFQRRSNANRG